MGKKMYTLTLTRDELNAFYFVGHRYSNGTAMLNLIESESDYDYQNDSRNEFTFKIPENKAWEIATLALEDNGLWPCFSMELAIKMQEFCDKIY